MMKVDISRINTRWIEGDTQPEAPAAKETQQEKLARHRKARFEQSDQAWEYVQANEDRYAKHRAEVLAKRKPSEQVYPFTDEALLEDAREVAKEYQWDHSQQKNTRLAVLTLEEANEYLDAFMQDTHGQLSTGKDYTGVATGLKGAYEVAKELGGLGATAKAVNINGVMNIVVENYKPRYLDIGPRWQAATPQMLKLGHALNTVKGNVTFLKGNVYVEIVFSGAVNAVDYMLHNEKTLGEVVGQFSADVAKGVVAGVIAQGFTLLVSGVIATFIAPPTVAVLGVFTIAAFGIGFIVSEIDDEYNFTEPMKREIEKLINEN
jgi:hypothetical protein